MRRIIRAPEPSAPGRGHSGQFGLLFETRFAPYFWTQCLGAINDTLFRFAFTVLLAYRLRIDGLPSEQVGLAMGAVFIIPFLFLSATAGELADRIEKAWLMRRIKELEVAVMVLAAWALLAPSPWTGLSCVLLLGVRSALFGPVKYAYLPQHLSQRELTGGNALVEMSTFAAIFLGGVLGGFLVSAPGLGREAVAVACVTVAVLGRVLAQHIPESPPSDPGLALSRNGFAETLRALRQAREDVAVFRALIGMSWLWALGAVLLANMPEFAVRVLRSDERTAGLLMMSFAVGITIGSLLCESLSRHKVEIGLVPIGALGMSVFLIDLYWASTALHLQHGRVILDLGLLALFAGVYSVPMASLIQARAPVTHRARIVAANNVLNALAILGASGLAALLLAAGLDLPRLLLAIGVLNLAVASYIVLLVPEYLLRFIAFVASRCMYRFRVIGDEHWPVSGPAIIAANHVSFVDAVLIMAGSPRPIRFLMDHRIFKLPILGAVFRLGKAIPIETRARNPEVYAAAFAAAAQVLADGELLGIFPEGSITRDGQMQPFKGGVMKIIETSPVPVVPVALHNLWGSFFSRIEQGRAMVRPFRRGVFNQVSMVVGQPIAPDQVDLERLYERIAALLQNTGDVGAQGGRQAQSEKTKTKNAREDG
jgi:1-acyl-sn-glycerol-3-phosphate acyltransferase